ncbi:MFS transporter [Embleya hyalina]|uniref:MFS transporter n=1 Tax=Embleya hyalina TaxID=516124 RepID=A0A401Z1N5_9ACTN|nr:MFS transporter [Embleya hyalina]GCE00790.1 MFS transporter [Embleya hyalina]
MRTAPLFLGGQAVSLVGDGVANLAVPLLVLQSTHNPVAAGLAAAPRAIGYTVVGLVGGVVVDRANPWRVLVWADVARTACFLALFALAGLRSVTAILVVAFVAGAASVFFQLALSIAVRDAFPDRLQSTNATLESANQIGFVAGPGIAGLLAATGMLRLGLLATAATFAVSVATLGLVRKHMPRFARPAAPRDWRTLRAELAAGLRYTTTTAPMSTLLWVMAIVNLVLGVDALIVYLLEVDMDLPPGQVGLVVAAGGVGGFIGALVSRWIRRVGPMYTLAGGTISFAVLLVVLGSVDTVAPAAAASFGMSASIVITNVMNRTMIQTIVPRELLGRVVSAQRMVSYLMATLGTVLAGAATGWAGGHARPVFWLAGTMAVATVLVAWRIGLRQHIHIARAGPARPAVVPAEPAEPVEVEPTELHGRAKANEEAD